MDSNHASEAETISGGVTWPGKRWVALHDWAWILRPGVAGRRMTALFRFGGSQDDGTILEFDDTKDGGTI